MLNIAETNATPPFLPSDHNSGSPPVFDREKPTENREGHTDKTKPRANLCTNAAENPVRRPDGGNTGPREPARRMYVNTRFFL